MANQDQVMIDLDFSRVNELFHYMETLHTQTSEMIMCLQSLQKNMQDSRKRFIDSLTKPYFQEEEVVRFKETSDEIQHVSKRVSDILLGDDEDFNPAGQSGDAAMRAKRLFFGSIVMKAFEDMMGSDSSVKRLEQDLHITIAAARSGVTFKKKEGGKASEQKLQILRSNCEEGFKKDQDGWRKSLIECIKECNESDKEFGVLNAIKVQAVEVGIELSRLMVDCVYDVRERTMGRKDWKFQICTPRS